MLVAGTYCVVGGMYSVILNDVIQLVLKVVASVIIAVIAIRVTTAEQLAQAVPAGWDNLFFGWRLDLDWSQHIPALQERIYGASPRGDGYALFGLFISALFVKGVLVSMAGPTPNYAIQHVLSTRSPREAALENLVMALVSLGPRFLLVSAIAVLGIACFGQDLASMGGKPDFEQILPKVVAGYVPIGCKGLLVAAMVAAFMSTFVSTANSGVAYIVNDIYRRYINPAAPQRKLVCLGLPLDGDRDSRGHRHRFHDRLDPRRHDMADLGLGPGLRGPQRAEVALVAVQRLGVLRRHGCRHRGLAPANGPPVRDLHAD